MGVNIDMKEKIVVAAVMKFEAQRAEATTNLALYLERATAIAEHPNVVEEVTTLVKQIAEAEECIKILNEHASGFTRVL